jgi:hypothetical protein
MADIDWYERQSELWPGMIFVTKDNEVVQLDRRVPGDGTKWYVLDLDDKGWSSWDGTIEPGDLDWKV